MLISSLLRISVVLDTTKVQIFKQITTYLIYLRSTRLLFQIPQRYRFSSKSQPKAASPGHYLVVLDTTKVQIFKQITTSFINNILRPALFQIPQRYRFSSKSQQVIAVGVGNASCFRYHKGTDFQANHNNKSAIQTAGMVVLDTTKVQIFKQITTGNSDVIDNTVLFQIPQRYRFSSKSQRYLIAQRLDVRCFRYHKGTDFQANHNSLPVCRHLSQVVLDTTKVQIFKQITTYSGVKFVPAALFQIPQRYRFSSKSQQRFASDLSLIGCFRYHKGTDFQANHN